MFQFLFYILYTTGNILILVLKTYVIMVLLYEEDDSVVIMLTELYPVICCYVTMHAVLKCLRPLVNGDNKGNELKHKH